MKTTLIDGTTKKGPPYKSRWERIKRQLERLADEEGWVVWGDLLSTFGGNTEKGQGLNAAQIRATLRAHKGELEARKYRRPQDRKFGRPRYELRLKKSAIPAEADSERSEQ